jgi:glycosyltransferase involved in cell wall biosynthesis
MKISIIIPCYNTEKFVGSAIRSVLAQTYPDVEIIVVDDGSTDDSWAEITSFEDHILAVRQENRGACHARNRGAHLASGDALMFLDADDLLTESTLSSLASTVGDKKNVIAACPWRQLRWSGEEWIESPSGKPFRPPEGDYIRGWLSGWFVPPCGLLWSRSAFQSVGEWDESLHANQDGDIVLRALLKNVEIHQTKEGKALYRTYESTNHTSVSRKQTKEALLSRAQVMEKVACRLEERGELAIYASEIGRELHKIAKRGFSVTETQSHAYLNRLEEIAGTARKIAGPDAITGNLLHRLGCRLLGLRRKEALAEKLAQVGIGRQIRRTR